MIIPPPLAGGDRIAIVSPAGAAVSENVENAAGALRRQGWEAVVMPHALGRFGTFSAPAADRLDDLRHAFLDPTIKAILCSRGGYGAVHLLPELDLLPLEKYPKWLIGFSDISALHALMQRHGIVSLHAPQTKHLARHPDDSDPCTAALFAALRGTMPSVSWGPSPLNVPDRAQGTLRGGNLAVISALIATPFSPFLPGTILVIEDIAEPVYKVERILCQLRMAGLLDSLAGIVVGQFTDYRPDINHASMQSMIADNLAGLSIPIAFDAPVGHVDCNHPLPLGLEMTLTVTPAGSRLTPADKIFSDDL